MNEEIKNKIINLYTNEKLAAEGISKQLKKEGIHLSRSPIGKFLTNPLSAVILVLHHLHLFIWFSKVS